MTRPFLLPVADAQELFVVLDALVAFANSCEQEYDDPSTARIADGIAERVREMKPLATVNAEQMLRSIGLGRARGRPQG